MCPKVYMCSQSPRRKDLLHESHIPFTLIPNQCDHEPQISPGELVSDYVLRLATLKVEASLNGYNGLVLGADTVVTLNNKIYGKPSSEEHALEIIGELLGASHQVFSAAVIYDSTTKEYHQCLDYAVVQFDNSTTENVLNYIRDHQPFDKAGAYGIQDSPPFLNGYKGEYSTILGLPMKQLYQLFSSYGIVK